MKFLSSYKFDDRIERGARFTSDRGDVLTIEVLEETLFRMRLLRGGRPHRLAKSWAIAPGDSDSPFEGRDRESLEGYQLSRFNVDNRADVTIIATPTLEARVNLKLAQVEWYLRGKKVLSERATGAVAIDPRGEKFWHSFAMPKEARFYGLGEASGSLDRRGRRFALKNLDAMGYDAETTDPLYKHFPFVIQSTEAGSAGIFYDNFATATFDLGCEIDNYHGPYFSYGAEAGDLDLYVFAEETVAEVSRKFTRLTGRPALPPKWSLGYSGSTMTYTDQPDSQKAMKGFLDKLRDSQIPCQSFHLSSGYTSIGKKRYVFNWNREKFPDPAALVSAFRERGIRFIPNVKPVLLNDHPRYEEARSLFVKDSEGDGPDLSQFWDGKGSHLDFTRRETVQWWKKNLTTTLLDLGIEAVWNDNNEYEIWDDEARVDGFGAEWPIKLGRPIQTLLMARASREALLEKFPGQRPFVVSRSGMPGMQRYVQTWSGDNTTDWKTLRYNLSMSLNLGLSGVANNGHDVGGFAGPRPDRDLFLRWIQHGIFYPRFVIHSWKEEGANEPWMYPELLPKIRELFALREKFEPYLYHLLRRARDHYEPVLRPLFYEFEKDPKAFGEHDVFLLGPDVLVANVFEKGATSLKLYLPENPRGWVDFKTGRRYEGGREITIPVSQDSFGLFVRGGAILPLKEKGQVEFRFHGPPSVASWDFSDDDGLSAVPQELRLALAFEMKGGVVDMKVARSGSWNPEYDSVRLASLAGDMRFTMNDKPVARIDLKESK
ncbi:MAG: TIM-barrel domain-containing protein [Bdellovibrionota bacterium]